MRPDESDYCDTDCEDDDCCGEESFVEAGHSAFRLVARDLSDEIFRVLHFEGLELVCFVGLLVVRWEGRERWLLANYLTGRLRPLGRSDA
jgi:hypothetical protein